ncbi:MAG: protein-disulfide reductase DsbD family protein [Luteolibacter sp.]
MKIFPMFVSLAMVSAAQGATHSGHAAAELIVASKTYEAAKPVDAAIRITVDPGWHTYWTNPGEGGMKLNVEWQLPEGWKASEIGWPVPVRFMTGDLPGFGYLGELVLPVTLIPPASAKGPAKIALKVDWLTCNDSACVPGDAALDLSLVPGSPAPTPAAPVIATAKGKVPAPLAGLKLEVKDADKNLVLTLAAPKDANPAAFAVFQATPQVVDPAAKIVFAKSGDEWTATVPKSEYLSGAAKTLDLVLDGGGLAHPATVSWSQK